jgi:hypothetical protein
MSACLVCSNSEAWHRRISESTDPVDLAFAEEHARMAIAKAKWEIAQLTRRLEEQEQSLVFVRTLRENRRARALHDLASIARQEGVLLRYVVGDHAVTSRALFNAPEVVIPLKPERLPLFTQQSADFMPKALECERFEVTILRAPNLPDAFKYAV